MRKSLWEYITALGHWSWVVFIDILLGATGAFLDISGSVGFPTTLWLVLLVAGMSVAPFFAFHKVRMQRDEALKLCQNDVTTRIIVVSNEGYEFQEQGSAVRLRLSPWVHAIPGVRVEDIQLEMKGKRYDTDWRPMTKAISGDIGEYVYVNLPQSLKAGKYQARIVAHIDNKEYYSDAFAIEYRKSVLDEVRLQI